ncbi:MAG TPA: ATP-binding protein [Candidatus Eisenbacteria bacterium]|nr:ATP-binding protein [Candidatus Eisenbacteria bacterium]
MTLYSARLRHFWCAQPEEDLSFEELLAEISARLVSLPADQVDHGIEEALRLICDSAGIDESTIYLREIENPDTFVLSYVLRDPDLPPPPTIKFTATDNFPWCNQKLIANEIIYLPDTQAAPEEAAVDKASWKKYNVVSALVIPLSTGWGRPLGFWGIDSTSERREWPERLQKRLRIIAGVFAGTIERAVSDRRLRESEARLELAAETGGAGFWTLDMETGAIWATPKLKELFGLKPDDTIDIATFLAMVQPADRESVRQKIEAMNQGKEINQEYRIVLPNGTIRWVMSRGSQRVFAIDGRPLLMGITLDTTERHKSEEALRTLGGRLIEAQEKERKRIARELHDDINQRIALITVSLGQSLSGDDAEVRKAVHLECERLSTLGHDVQALSHRLHSSKIEYLGLASAARGLCREMAEQHRVEIHFVEAGIPRDLSSQTSICLFRVLQEAVHNAVKYSGVGQITVELKSEFQQIQLVVRDRGRGFDPEEAMERGGLGLISMRERLQAVGGELSINSQPHEGTTVKACVPVTCNATQVEVMEAAG